MPREIMERRAADNRYFHPDFHGALSTGIDYLERRYGPDAVREYLREFTLTFYAPLREELRARGLAALRDHFERVYRDEGGQIEIALDADELRIEVAASPAVLHMRARGYRVARLFGETIGTVNAALCEGTAYESEVRDYDPETGRCVQIFRRKRT